MNFARWSGILWSMAIANKQHYSDVIMSVIAFQITGDSMVNRLFRRRSTKTSKLRVTGLCERNSPMTGGFPAQRARNVENVSILWRHHESGKDCFLMQHNWNISYETWENSCLSLVCKVSGGGAKHRGTLSRNLFPFHLFSFVVINTVRINCTYIEYILHTIRLFMDPLCYCCIPIWNMSMAETIRMMTSSNGNIFRATGPFVRGIHRSRWIPHTKASDTELWCLLWSASE